MKEEDDPKKGFLKKSKSKKEHGKAHAHSTSTAGTSITATGRRREGRKGIEPAVLKTLWIISIVLIIAILILVVASAVFHLKIADIKDNIISGPDSGGNPQKLYGAGGTYLYLTPGLKCIERQYLVLTDENGKEQSKEFPCATASFNSILRFLQNGGYDDEGIFAAINNGSPLESSIFYDAGKGYRVKVYFDPGFKGRLSDLEGADTLYYLDIGGAYVKGDIESFDSMKGLKVVNISRTAVLGYLKSLEGTFSNAADVDMSDAYVSGGISSLKDLKFERLLLQKTDIFLTKDDNQEPEVSGEYRINVDARYFLTQDFSSKATGLHFCRDLSQALKFSVLEKCTRLSVECKFDVESRFEHCARV